MNLKNPIIKSIVARISMYFWHVFTLMYWIDIFKRQHDMFLITVNYHIHVKVRLGLFAFVHCNSVTGHFLSLALSWHFRQTAAIWFAGLGNCCQGLPTTPPSTTVTEPCTIWAVYVRNWWDWFVLRIDKHQIDTYDVWGRGLWEQAIQILDEVCCKEARSARMISVSRKTSKQQQSS